jgi:hypothetical protein
MNALFLIRCGPGLGVEARKALIQSLTELGYHVVLDGVFPRFETMTAYSLK